MEYCGIRKACGRSQDQRTEEYRLKSRHRQILDLLVTQGACTYQELSARFDVSTMTIRRDVEFLAGQGLLIKTLGGVQNASAPSYFFETPLYSRISKNRDEKREIAERALELIESGQTLFIDGSTTCQQLARLIADERQGLTIVTNSALVAIEVGKSTNNMTVCIGGQFERDTVSFIGASAEEAAGKYFVDMCLISTKGFVPAEGTFESSVGNLTVKQRFSDQSAHTILLVDHSKFGARALTKAIDISRIGTVVTDAATSQSDLDLLQELGKDVKVSNATGKRPKERLNAS